MARTYTFIRDNQETEVFVDYKMTSAGCSAHMGSMSYAGHPAEDPEFEVQKIWNAERQEISSMLTRAEWNRLDDEIYQAGCDDDWGPDPDDMRDAMLEREFV